MRVMGLHCALSRRFLVALRDDCRIPPGSALLVAVSGGADSVALLRLLHALAPHYPLTLTVAHLDHAIRAESGTDAAFVVALSRTLQLPCVSERIDVPALATQLRIGLEEAGRHARQEFLRTAAAAHGCATVALGHHRGDQAETLLHHLLRGCGPGGLAGMRPAGFWVRPLLDFSRDELRDYLAGLEQEFREDASNADTALLRNRLRHELLPLLSEINPRLESALATLARCAAGEDDYWQAEVARLLPTIVTATEAGVVLAVPALRDLHPALRARLLRTVLAKFAVARKTEYGFTHVAALEELLSNGRPQGERHLPGLWAARRFERLLLADAPPEQIVPWRLAVAAPGRYRLGNGEELRVSLSVGAGEESPSTVEFATELPWPLTVRALAPGDRMTVAGLDGHKRLKDLVREARLSHEERRRLVVVEGGGEVVWLAGVRRCDSWRAAPGVPVLRLELHPATGGAD